MPGPSRLVLAAAVLAAAAGLVGCHGNTRATASKSGSASAGRDTVAVHYFSFEPSSLAVPVGATVTWVFEDTAAHTMQISRLNVTSPALSGGRSFSYRFTTAGTYSYICSIHQYMHAAVVVLGGAHA
jgi:plastocyanin